jgi:hypothetical protein
VLDTAPVVFVGSTRRGRRGQTWPYSCSSLQPFLWAASRANKCFPLTGLTNTCSAWYGSSCSHSPSCLAAPTAGRAHSAAHACCGLAWPALKPGPEHEQRLRRKQRGPDTPSRRQRARHSLDTRSIWAACVGGGSTRAPPARLPCAALRGNSPLPADTEHLDSLVRALGSRDERASLHLLTRTASAPRRPQRDRGRRGPPALSLNGSRRWGCHQPPRPPYRQAVCAPWRACPRVSHGEHGSGSTAAPLGV